LFVGKLKIKATSEMAKKDKVNKTLVKIKIATIAAI
jgi:hypothetical protein